MCAHGRVQTDSIPTLVQLAVCFGSQIFSSEVYSYVLDYLCRRDNEGKVWDLLENSVKVRESAPEEETFTLSPKE